MKTIDYDYYIFLDYSVDLIGYVVISHKNRSNLLERTYKLKHFSSVKNKRLYLSTAKRILEPIKELALLESLRVAEMRNSMYLFQELIKFIQKDRRCLLFISIDDRHYQSFMRLLDMAGQQPNLKVLTESQLVKGSNEYKLSLIIDSWLNIKRMIG